MHKVMILTLVGLAAAHAEEPPKHATSTYMPLANSIERARSVGSQFSVAVRLRDIAIETLASALASGDTENVRKAIENVRAKLKDIEISGTRLELRIDELKTSADLKFSASEVIRSYTGTISKEEYDNAMDTRTSCSFIHALRTFRSVAVAL